MANLVTDPAILQQLEGSQGARPVTDPALLAQLEQPVGVGEDLAKTALPSMARMAAGTLGLPGDVAGLMNRGIDYVGQKLGAKPTSPADYNLLGSQQIEHGIEKVTGPLYQPQTTAGKLADTAAQFLPAVLGGPETLAAKVGTRVLAPAAGLEAAKAATDNPYAQVAAAIASSALAHKAVTPGAAKAALPETDQIRAAARAGYQHPEVAAIEINPRVVSQKADDIITDLNRQGFRKLGAPQTYDLVQELKAAEEAMMSPQAYGVGPTAKIADVESVRSALGNVSKEVNGVGRPTADAVAAGHAMKHVDNFMVNLRQPDLLAGNARAASSILQQARQDWASYMKSSDIGNRLTRAERQAAKSGSGSNIDNAIRQKISAVLDVPSRTVGLRPNEIAQAERVVRGTPATNTLRKVGKLGFGDGLSLMLHLGATLPTAGLNIPVGIAATIARKVGERMTQQNANKLEEMIRGRSSEAQKWAAIQARLNATNPQPRLGSLRGGLLSGAFAQPSRGLLALDQIGQQ